MTFATSDIPPLLSSSDLARGARLSRISWGAVIAGVVLALAAHLILNMIGLAIGAGNLAPSANEAPAADRFSVMAALWWTVSGIIAAFVGGFTGGRLCGVRPAWLGAWHGVASRALTTLIVVYFMGTALGAFVSGTLGTVSQISSKAADVATKAVSRGALVGAIALVLGALAAMMGGRMGAITPSSQSALES